MEESMEDMKRRFDPVKSFGEQCFPLLGENSGWEEIIYFFVMLGRSSALLTNEEVIDYIVVPTAHELNTGEESGVVPPCYQ